MTALDVAKLADSEEVVQGLVAEQSMTRSLRIECPGLEGVM